MRNSVTYRSRSARMLLGVGGFVLAGSMIGTVRRQPARWTPAELALLGSLSIRTLEPVGADPSNRYATDPRAASLGRELFFDARFSGNGKVACATCHVMKFGGAGKDIRVWKSE